jgi:hypothetical protein
MCNVKGGEDSKPSRCSSAIDRNFVCVKAKPLGGFCRHDGMFLVAMCGPWNSSDDESGVCGQNLVATLVQSTRAWCLPKRYLVRILAW